MPKLKKVVELDYSKNSFRVLTKAIEIAKEVKDWIRSILGIHTCLTEIGDVKTIAWDLIIKIYP